MQTLQSFKIHSYTVIYSILNNDLFWQSLFLLFNIQYNTILAVYTIYSPYYCIVIILFYVIAKFVYLVTIYFYCNCML